MTSMDRRLIRRGGWRIAHIFPLVAALALAAVILAGCSSSSATSTNGAYGGPSNHLHDMLALQGVSNTVLLASHFGIYRTDDGGKTWKQITGNAGQPMKDLMPYKLVQSPADPRRIYVPAIPRTTTGPADRGTPGIYVSADTGRSWRLVTPMTAFPGGTVYSIGPGAAADELYALAPTYTDFQPYNLYITHDSGSHWTKLPDLPTSRPTGVTADPLWPGRLLLWSGTDGLYTSDNKGQSWQKVLGVQRGIDVLTLAGKTIYAAGDAGIYASQDDGAHFALVPMQKTFIAVAASKGSPQDAYALLSNAVYATTDGGKSWHATASLARGPAGLTVDPSDGSVIYVGQALPLGVEVSTNGGSSWRTILP
jgi:photosystem II stability/assembly factor-like uncharacterized protein